MSLRLGFSQEVTVDFEGRISNDNTNLAEAIVQVLQNGKLLTSFKTDKDGSYNVYLPVGSDYIISISKKDYVQKYFSVSTTGIPPEKSKNKFPVMVADIDLLKHYDGVDYSIFNEPANKYYYNPKRDNMEYDKDYLKEMQESLKLLKKAQKEAILLALQKGSKKQETKVKGKKELQANKPGDKQQKPEEFATTESVLEKSSEKDEKVLVKSETNSEVKLNIVVASPETGKKIIDKKIADLLSKYKEGVTEERVDGNGIIIIKRVVVREQEAWVYEKRIFNWGGVSYFRDRQPITAGIFEQETAGKGL